MRASTYFVGLGSNVDPARHLAATLDRLLERFGAVQVSRIARTAPLSVSGGTFLNAVVSFRSAMPAHQVKELFCALEEEFGRDRSDPDRAHRARTIDVDILFQLPPGARHVDGAAVPAESYYRAPTLELIGLQGLSCPVTSPPTENAVAFAFGSAQIGLHPVQLHRDRTGTLVAGRAARAALVTGGAVRVGREIALALARAGYDVAIHYNASAAPAEATASECRALGVRCEAFQGDFSDPGCLPGLFADVQDRFPHLQVLVNSASVYEGGRIADTSAALLDRQWCVNFKAPFLLMKEFAARIDHGTVVNVLDNKIAFNQFHYAAYLTAKKALAEATRMAALEFAPRVRVNGLSPGVILPASTRDQAYLDWRREGIPVGHLGDPAQLCEALLLLVANPFITGQILAVDGGESASFTGRNAHDFRNGHGEPVTADTTGVLHVDLAA